MLTLTDKERKLPITPGVISNEICGGMRPDQEEIIETYKIDGQKTLGELVDALTVPDTNLYYLKIARDNSGQLVANFLREHIKQRLKNIMLPYGFDADLEQPISGMNGVYFDRFALPNKEGLEFMEIGKDMSLHQLLNIIGEQTKGSRQISYLEVISADTETGKSRLSKLVGFLKRKSKNPKKIVAYKTSMWGNN